LLLSNPWIFTQNNLYGTNPTVTTIVTREQIMNSFAQSTSESARLKVGFVVPLQYASIMPYFTAGCVHSTLQGTFGYSASSCREVNARITGGLRGGT
jgi:hypothetical protein